MKLDEYSINFSEVLYSVFPEFEQYQEIKEYDECNEAYLLIEVPSPYNVENILWLSTYGEEITVGFDWYHTHFDYAETDEDNFKLAVEHVKEIVEEKISIAVIKRENLWVRSYIITSNDFPEVNVDETLEIKSWNDTKYFIGNSKL